MSDSSLGPSGTRASSIPVLPSQSSVDPSKIDVSYSAPGRAFKRATELFAAGKARGGVRESVYAEDPRREDGARDIKGPGIKLRRHSVNIGRSIRRKLKNVSGALTRRSKSISYSENQAIEALKVNEPRHSLTLPSPRTPLSAPNSPLDGSVFLQEDVAIPQLTMTSAAGIDEFLTEEPTTSPIIPAFSDSIAPESFVVPQILLQGTALVKVSNKKEKLSEFVFRLDADQGRIVWESKVHKFIPVENIREIRIGQAAIQHILHLQCSPVEDYLPRWLTLIYVGPPSSKARSKVTLSPLPISTPKSTYSVHTYKTLHLVASSPLIVTMWERTLKAMIALRASLTSGLGFGGGVNSNRNMEEIRQVLWERSFWTAAGGSSSPSSSAGLSIGGASGESASSPGLDHHLTFNEMKILCERLNVRMSQDEVHRLFQRADVNKRGFLDFEGFRRFGKQLKARPELDRLYKNLVRTANTEDVVVRDALPLRSLSGSSIDNDSLMTFSVFEDFMRETQKSELSTVALKDIFDRYSIELPDISVEGSLFLAAPCAPSSSLPTPPLSSPSSLNVDELESDPSHVPPSALFATSTSPLPSTRVMTQEAFTSFLLSADNSACLEPRPEANVDRLPHRHGFTSHSTAFPPHSGVTTLNRLSEISHDMTRPLSDYYISSSHNTYLIGHQLYGESTVEGYVRALLGGCRSVELDIFDTDTGPQIFHGKTLTTKVPLREVCEAISTYGFIASPYPLIISAEIHCGLVGQSQLVEIMKDVFGNRLVRRDETGTIIGMSRSVQPPENNQVLLTESAFTELPSPEELRGRILVKAKNLLISERKDTPALVHSSSTSSSVLGSPFEVSTSSTSDTDVMSDRSSSSRRYSEFRAEGILQRVRRRGKSDSSLPPSSYVPRSSMRALDSGNSSHSRSSSMSDAKAKPKMSPDLLALLVFTVGTKFRGINKKVGYRPEEMFSLSENNANKILKVGMIDLIKHTRGHLVRIYPKGTRVNSTNYEPHRYWSAGAQLVAINWQTTDLGYMINYAMFQRNGGCGYLLKPLPMREPHKGLLSRQTQHLLEITVISAQHLPAPKDSSGRDLYDKFIVNPYVQVSIYVPDWPTPPPTSLALANSVSNPGPGLTSSASGSSLTSSPRLGRSVSYSTSTVKNNGFNPVWEEKLSIPFACVGDMKELIFVQFAVRHSEREDVEPLAQFCASLGCLRPGYRHLPLHDSQMSQYIFSTLFVRLDIL